MLVLHEIKNKIRIKDLENIISGSNTVAMLLE
jgi:hypothetical protein